MKKNIIITLIFIFIVYSGFSQQDSGKAAIHDSIIKSDINSISQVNIKKIVSAPAKEPIYKLKLGADIPIVAAGTIWSLYAFTKIYNKPLSTIEQIQSLKTSNINTFDRSAIYPYSKSLYRISNYPFYASMPLPLVFIVIGKNTRSDFFKLCFLYWEAMSITGFLGTAAPYFVDRYRPYAYTQETSMDLKTARVAKNSFYAGHVEVVATPTFFIAKVYADYNPDSNVKWLFYGLASAATGATAYLRVRSGQHFLTDVILATATGSLAGILVPQSHKTKSKKYHSISILPYSSGDINGMLFTYKL